MDASNITNRLNSIKSQIETGKSEKAKAEANLETYTKQKDEIVTQLTALNVTPETLDDEITRLEQEIENRLSQAETLLNGNGEANA